MNKLFYKRYFLVGVMLAVAFSALHAFVPYEYSTDALAVVTGAAGGVYFGIGLSAESAKKMWIQLLTGGVFVVAAALGLWVSPLFFALAFFAHGCWDIVTVHPNCLAFQISKWYMPMCVGYDFLFAMYLFVWYAVGG